MENATKAIIIAAAVVITLALVTIGFLVMRSGQDTAKTAISKVDKMNSDMTDSEYLVYDGTTISGSEVVNAINKYKKEQLGISVATKAAPSTTTWYIKDVDITSDVGEISGNSANTIKTDPTDDAYILPNGRFQGKVYRDANGGIVAIEFKQQ